MTDVLSLIRALEGPPAPPDPPAWPARRPALPLAAGGALLCLAAGVLVFVGRDAAPVPSPPTPGLRGPVPPDAGLRGADTPVGAVAAAGAEVDLRLAVERPGGLERVRRDAAYRRGDRVFLQVAASRDAAVTVWVEGPAGVERIAEVAAGRAPVDVRAPGGFLAYEFTSAGPHTFVASPGGFGACAPPACFRQTVEVR